MSVAAGTRLNTIFAQLASFENPDFLGMDAGLNSLKGSVCYLLSILVIVLPTRALVFLTSFVLLPFITLCVSYQFPYQLNLYP